MKYMLPLGSLNNGSMVLVIQNALESGTDSPTKNTENNRFRVPIHFANNRFTFEFVSLPPFALPPLLQPIAFEVSFHLNLQSQSPWSLCNGTW